MDNADQRARDRAILAPTLVAEPLRTKVGHATAADVFQVIIELNLNYPGGRTAAEAQVRRFVIQAAGEPALARNHIDSPTHPYVFAAVTASQLRSVLAADGEAAIATAEDNVPHRTDRAIFRVWDSTEIRPLTNVSIRTVKADAAQTAYSARGEGVVWAVLDSGIDKTHPHFAAHQNLELPAPLEHQSFAPTAKDPLADAFGHGTHVAGIIAGESSGKPIAATASVDASGSNQQYHLRAVPGIRGMAPECTLLSLRVLDDNGAGDVTAVMNALEYIQRANGYGEHLIVHGVNLSAGYLPDVRWYGTGQTPICNEVDRLVRSGVSVVVAAGNTGYVMSAAVQADAATQSEAGQLVSINDPGNAALAITVGSTHREKPHAFGISYFSSKGPTADGRQKPDLVAPGENIISCAAGVNVTRVVAGGVAGDSFQYVEDTGTSMAAPHVSGVIAAFMSIRPEYQGQGEQLRAMVIATATDLGRDPRMQGAGLVDLIRLIASV